VNPPAFIGRYRILGVLGEGAMGRVYRGRDESLERDVAVKVMTLGHSDADARARFQKEARAAARLQHPNIVTIYELGEHEGSPFMALELLEGSDLQRAIEAGIRPDPKVTFPIVLQVLAGLSHAHENRIVHRDVKPSNVFLPRNRPSKIMDFGVARLVGSATTTGLVVGTPNYMSPEQVRAGDLDGRSDLFSVGLILYELVTGEKAYAGDSVVSLLYKIVNERPDLDLIPKGPQWERLRGVLAQALAKRPEDRYPDAHAMGADLVLALKDLGGSPDWMTRSDQALLVRARPRGGEVAAPATPAPVAVPVTSGPVGKATAPDAGGSVAPPPASRLPLAIAGTLGGGAVVLLAAAVVLMTRGGDGPPPSPAVASAVPVSPSPGASGEGAASSPTPSAAPTPSGTPPPTTAPTPSATPRPSTVPSPSAPPAPPATPPPSPSPSPTPPPPPEATLPPEPSPADARLDRANAHMNQRRYAQALAEARAVLRREPNNPEAQTLAQDAEFEIFIETCVSNAAAALRAGDRDLAKEEAMKGLRMKPTDSRLLALFREATQ